MNIPLFIYFLQSKSGSMKFLPKLKQIGGLIFFFGLKLACFISFTLVFTLSLYQTNLFFTFSNYFPTIDLPSPFWLFLLLLFSLSHIEFHLSVPFQEETQNKIRDFK